MKIRNQPYCDEAGEALLQCEIAAVRPHSLMLSPVFVFMPLNEKLVAVKGTLDFFVRDELERLQTYETFYVQRPEEKLIKFQNAARDLRSLLNAVEESQLSAPSECEVSREVIKTLGPLWLAQGHCTPLTGSVFTDELCNAMDPELMVWAREKTIKRHEVGLYVSGRVIFFLVHLGYFNITQLNQIRESIYSGIVERDETWEDPKAEWQMIARDARRNFKIDQNVAPADLQVLDSEWAAKLYGRVAKLDSLVPLNADLSVNENIIWSGLKK